MEHKNRDLKRTLEKICEETVLQWPEALHLAHIPNGRHGLITFLKTSVW